jgi:hypothetical protein
MLNNVSSEIWKTDKSFKIVISDGYHLFVTGGWSNQKQINSSELIDLSDSLRTCRKWTDYPRLVQSSVAVNLNNQNVLVCGGNVDGYKENSISDCYKLDVQSDSGIWSKVEDMKV